MAVVGSPPTLPKFHRLPLPLLPTTQLSPYGLWALHWFPLVGLLHFVNAIKLHAIFFYMKWKKKKMKKKEKVGGWMNLMEAMESIVVYLYLASHEGAFGSLAPLPPHSLRAFYRRRRFSTSLLDPFLLPLEFWEKGFPHYCSKYLGFAISIPSTVLNLSTPSWALFMGGYLIKRLFKVPLIDYFKFPFISSSTLPSVIGF